MFSYNKLVTPLKSQPSPDDILSPNQHASKINHTFDARGIRQSIDTLITSESQLLWKKAIALKLDRSAQDYHEDKGNNTMDFICKHKVPARARIKYTNMVCDFKPLKKENFQA